MWPVTVKSRGLGGSERKVIPGQYRLCLTNKDLSLIRTMKTDQSDIVLPVSSQSLNSITSLACFFSPTSSLLDAADYPLFIFLLIYVKLIDLIVFVCR